MKNPPSASGTPANTFIHCIIKSGRLRNEDDTPGPRIVHMEFRRPVYNECHMILTPLGAVIMALDLLVTAFVATVWIGKLHKKEL